MKLKYLSLYNNFYASVIVFLWAFFLVLTENCSYGNTEYLSLNFNKLYKFKPFFSLYNLKKYFCQQLRTLHLLWYLISILWHSGLDYQQGKFPLVKRNRKVYPIHCRNFAWRRRLNKATISVKFYSCKYVPLVIRHW